LPGFLADVLGQPFLQLSDPGSEAVGAFLRGEQVGLQ
jgi:hypothetical protein